MIAIGAIAATTKILGKLSGWLVAKRILDAIPFPATFALIAVAGVGEKPCQSWHNSKGGTSVCILLLLRFAFEPADLHGSQLSWHAGHCLHI